MARFVFDVANCDKEEASKVMDRITEELGDKVATIRVIDLTNTCQFSNNEKEDVLTKRQILNFNQKKDLL
jgi:nucleoid DNA-binding protein